MARFVQFFREVWIELQKVVWPTRKAALKLTGIVIAFSLAVALFLGLVDFGLQRAINWLISR